MKEEACFGAGLCEGFSGESEILVFFVVEELPAFCNDRVCRVYCPKSLRGMSCDKKRREVRESFGSI
jgi:hypothetical protein